MNDPRTILLPFLLVVLGSPLACIWLSFRPIWRWKGPVRWFGLVGAAPVLWFIAWLVIDIVKGTVPNLWPFGLVLSSGAGLLLLAILHGVRWLTRDERANEAPRNEG